MLVPASGGPESQISELSMPSSISWSADGQWLIATDGPARMRSIVAISVATGAKHVLTGPFEFGYSGAGVSPDLRRLLFSRAGPGAWMVCSTRSLLREFITNLTVRSVFGTSIGRTHEVFVPPNSMGIGLAVSPDGASLLFTQVERRDADLYSIDGLR
jgi:hypothetical protein